MNRRKITVQPCLRESGMPTDSEPPRSNFVASDGVEKCSARLPYASLVRLALLLACGGLLTTCGGAGRRNSPVQQPKEAAAPLPATPNASPTPPRATGPTAPSPPPDAAAPAPAPVEVNGAEVAAVD